jgi:hypothetical protein
MTAFCYLVEVLYSTCMIAGALTVQLLAVVNQWLKLMTDLLYNAIIIDTANRHQQQRASL